MAAIKTYMTFKELVVYTGYKEKTLYRYVERGLIPCFQPPGTRKLLFSITAVDAWIAAGRRPTAAELATIGEMERR